MAHKDLKRKLTAIFSADVAGYSRLMSDDDEATVRTITLYRDMMADFIHAHSGRVLDAKGDNILAEFASVLFAVRCAVEIQKELNDRNAELPENRRMEFRIGINLGDVIEEDGTIYGDGVNIAARLESLSNPGGICISKSAFDQIESKVPFEYEYIGGQKVKNIPKPVKAYRVSLESSPARSVIHENRFLPINWKWMSLTAAVLIIVGVIIGSLILIPDTALKDVGFKEHVPSESPPKPSNKTIDDKNLKIQLIFWESIKDSKDYQMFEEYLRKFPNGIFTKLAKLHIVNYSKQKMVPRASKRPTKALSERALPKKALIESYEMIFWQSIENSKNIDVFQEYLRRFPDGVFVGLAKVSLKALQKEESKKTAGLTKPKEKSPAKITKGVQESPKLTPHAFKPKPDRLEFTADKKELKSNGTIELAIFPWNLNISQPNLPTPTKSHVIDALTTALNDYKLVVPKFTYYDLGTRFDTINIKDKLLTESIVSNIWTKSSFFPIKN